MAVDASRDNLRGALYMVIGMAGFGLNDALVKSTADSVSLYQAVLVRGLFATALVALLAWRWRALRFRAIGRRDRRLVALRTLGETGATLCFLNALFNMPLANATAILQVTPLALTLAAAVVLGEPVGWRRLTAIAVGFAGVLIVVRPGFEGFNAYSLSALGTVGFIVLRDLVTRRLSPTVPALGVTLVTAATITTLGGALSVTAPWQPIGGGDLAALAAAAVCLFVGYLCLVLTMRVGSVAIAAPLRYTILLWAIGLGYVVFGERPDGWTLLGSAIVVASGLYTLVRERRLAARAATRP
jgi:drug/metabolite transporter (DMT)-like permease